MPQGFFIQSVAIEGFKGFTTRQVIDFGGRHGFLLGQNGNGKSSIIEAIRWGLFGSTRRRNEIVANRDYTGRCRVEIALVRDGKLLNFRRLLLQGASGGSDPTLTDENGNELSIQAIMPQLDSVDTGEGMHIIFAPQSTPLRRQPEDLSPFERTVFNHLGLSHPAALLDHIERLMLTQERLETKLGEDLTSARTVFEGQVDLLEKQRAGVRSAPPWDTPRAPSVADSENKARQFITDITGKAPDDSLTGLSLEALLDSAEDDLMGSRDQDQGALEEDASTLAGRIEALHRFQDIRGNIEERQTELQQAQHQWDEMMRCKTLLQLRQDLDEARAAAEAIAIKSRVITDAVSLLTREQGESVPCPVCDMTHIRDDFQAKLQSVGGMLSGSDLSELTLLEEQVQSAERLTQEIENIQTEIETLGQNSKSAFANVDDKDKNHIGNGSTASDVAGNIALLVEREVLIGQQIEDKQAWFEAKWAQLSKLKDEGRYHNIQNRLADLQIAGNRFDRVKTAYDDLVVFGESVRTIHGGVKECLNERLEEEMPNLSERLSEVFVGLTHHSWWDRLTIAKGGLPKLELRVASSGDPSGNEHPVGVLNGQSESALALVPYFAFSQVEGTPTEVYLVLLDDPTRAFDEEHTGILVERLADLGRNVQLVVASHETARFRDLLPKHFDVGSYVTVEPTEWTYHDGPKLVVELG